MVESSAVLKVSPKDAKMNKRLNELELENERLKKKLDMANKIIDFQKNCGDNGDTDGGDRREEIMLN